MEKNRTIKSFFKTIMVAVIVSLCWYWAVNITPGPKYIEGAGMFMIPATPDWSDADIKSATDRLVRERQLRVELAQLLEENAGK